MKALTNILTHLLMLLMIFIMACTEEAVEVNNLSRQEQHVMVRMQVPGMTAAATRADNEETITSVTALVFDSDSKLLKVVSATDITTEKFNLTVPNGTKNIHFLANLPENYDLSGVQKESDLTTLTTTYYDNLVYWGMTTYEGTTNTLSTILYRNMAKITLAPDEEFPFEGELTIAGLDNPNTIGTLVPYTYSEEKVVFHNTGVAPTYLTLPDGVETLDETPIGNDGAGYGNSLYVFEHANSNYMDKGLFVFCKIGEDAYYSVALTRDGVTPYEIKRNHEYIIYVSDVDDYQTNDYRAESYDALFDGEGKTIKKPINLEVKEVAQVEFSNTGNKTIDWNNGNPNSFDVAMSNIAEGTVTLTIAAKGFQVTQDGNELQKVEDNYIYTGSNTTFTFKPTIIGSHQITITGSGQYATVPSTTINVTVQASIKVDSATPTQLYYDSNEEQTVTVNVTIPTGVEILNISAEDFIFGEDSDGDYTYTTNSQTSAALSFKLKSGIAEANKTSTITISDASGNATHASVSINLVNTPVVTFTYTDNPTLNLNNNETYSVTMNVPNDGILTTLSIAAEGFTVRSQNGELSAPTNNVYTYIGGTTTFIFTPTSAGSRTIRFYSGEGVNINVPEKNISVTVNASITATATPSTIYHDGNDKTVTVSVTIPKGVSGLNISATNFSYGDDADGLYTYNRDDATTQEKVDFVFILKDGVTDDSSITFSDASANENVSSATVDINVEATPVVTNALTVKPITPTVIDLTESGNKTVQLRLAIPDDLQYMKINTNYAFTVSALNGYNQPRPQAPNYYYDYIKPGSVNTIDLEFTMVTDNDKIFEVAGEYPITFYTSQNSSEGVTATITVQNGNLGDDVIWKGSKVMNLSSGHILYYTSFKDYRDSGKKLKIDLTPADGWKQFFIKYQGDDNKTNLASFTGNDLPSTFSIDIPLEDRDLNISGSNVTITKIYIGEGE